MAEPLSFEVQTIFDLESFSYVQKPIDCNGHCMGYDFIKHTSHRHCEATMGPSLCNAMVFTVSDGPDNAWAVEEGQGSICAECRWVACETCTHTSIDGTRKLCSDCALNERKHFEDAIRADQALIEVERGLESYMDFLATERDDNKIRDSARIFDRVLSLVERVHSQILPSLERASALQQILPIARAS